MGRKARVVIAGTPHHVTQRGNRRQPTFFDDADYMAYLQIAAEVFPMMGVEVWAYCLMPNHVHLIATPSTAEGLARAVGLTHLRYTRRVNLRKRWTGYLWQGRFASFPMDDDYLRACVRYVGLNPVRAGLAARAIDWPWSSVAAHVGDRADLLAAPGMGDRLGRDMAGFFDVDLAEEALRKLRRAGRWPNRAGAARRETH